MVLLAFFLGKWDGFLIALAVAGQTASHLTPLMRAPPNTLCQIMDRGGEVDCSVILKQKSVSITCRIASNNR